MTVAEQSLIDAADPAYVSPLGDRRERAVPCGICRTPTLALRALCPVHQFSEVAPAASSDAGGVCLSPERDATGTPANEKSPAPLTRPGHDQERTS